MCPVRVLIEAPVMRCYDAEAWGTLLHIAEIKQGFSVLEFTTLTLTCRQVTRKTKKVDRCVLERATRRVFFSWQRRDDCKKAANHSVFFDECCREIHEVE